jgi:hypothetical protein
MIKYWYMYPKEYKLFFKYEFRVRPDSISRKLRQNIFARHVNAVGNERTRTNKPRLTPALINRA